MFNSKKQTLKRDTFLFHLLHSRGEFQQRTPEKNGNKGNSSGHPSAVSDGMFVISNEAGHMPCIWQHVI